MPSVFPHPCGVQGCPRTTKERYCQNHQHLAQQAKRLHDLQRGTAAERGYGYHWQQARLSWLAEHPLCAMCERDGRVTAATEVDHIIPHRGDMVKFWNLDNWQSACEPCHKAKTAREDGAFGNRRKDG